jgi:hypothetical protein
MKNLNEANKAAQQEGTQAALKFRGGMGALILGIIGVAVLIGLYLVVSKELHEYSTKAALKESSRRAMHLEKPAATVIILSPGGVSDRIPVPYMKKVVMGGKDFHMHCVYANKAEESFRPGIDKPCSDGDLPYVYASNDRGDKPNAITYSYADP